MFAYAIVSKHLCGAFENIYMCIHTGALILLRRVVHSDILLKCFLCIIGLRNSRFYIRKTFQITQIKYIDKYSETNVSETISLPYQ